MEPKLWINRPDGSVTGPHGMALLRRDLNEGTLTLDDLACEDGTEDWMPLETWGSQLYPPERKKVHASQVAAADEKDGGGIGFLSGLTVVLSFIGIIYFVMFYDVGVSTGFGTVANLHKMNNRLVGLIACGLGILLAVAMELMKKRRK